MTLAFCILFGVFVVVPLSVLGWMLLRAPMGRQDDGGFHFEEKTNED
jgi:hypothetical protein